MVCFTLPCVAKRVPTIGTKSYVILTTHYVLFSIRLVMSSGYM